MSTFSFCLFEALLPFCFVAVAALSEVTSALKLLEQKP